MKKIPSKVIFLLTFLMTLTLIQPSNAEVKPFIVGGVDASITSHPYQLALYYGNDASNSQFRCGGVLISDDPINAWVLTAAHCLDFSANVSAPVYEPFSKFRVVGGLSSLPSATTLTGVPSDHIANVTEITVHPGAAKFNQGTAEEPNYILIFNDIALLKIDKVPAGSSKINALGVKADENTGTSSLITGWGTTSTTASVFPTKLQVGSVSVISDLICSNAYGEVFDSLTQICTGSGTPAICSGDSGGPLATRVGASFYSLTGISSYGDEVCGDRPGVFVRVSAFIDWIKVTTNASFFSNLEITNSLKPSSDVYFWGTRTSGSTLQIPANLAQVQGTPISLSADGVLDKTKVESLPGDRQITASLSVLDNAAAPISLVAPSPICFWRQSDGATSKTVGNDSCTITIETLIAGKTANTNYQVILSDGVDVTSFSDSAPSSITASLSLSETITLSPLGYFWQTVTEGNTLTIPAEMSITPTPIVMTLNGEIDTDDPKFGTAEFFSSSWNIFSSSDFPLTLSVDENCSFYQIGGGNSGPITGTSCNLSKSDLVLENASDVRYGVFSAISIGSTNLTSGDVVTANLNIVRRSDGVIDQTPPPPTPPAPPSSGGGGGAPPPALPLPITSVSEPGVRVDGKKWNISTNDSGVSSMRVVVGNQYRGKNAVFYQRLKSGRLVRLGEGRVGRLGRVNLETQRNLKVGQKIRVQIDGRFRTTLTLKN